MKIIRISTFYHDSSACLVDNGNIVSAVQEERFTRIKYDSSFPLKSINYCLKNSNLTIEDNEKLNNLKEIDQQRSSIPAVTHLDYSARVQTVNKYNNENFYNLIDEFRKITGVPILLNTSFNARGEPIVNTPWMQ